MTDPARAAAVEMDCCRCFSSHFLMGRSDHSSIRLDHLKALNIPRLKRPQAQGQRFEGMTASPRALHPLSHFYSTPFHSFSPSSDSVLRSMHHSFFFFSSPSSSSLAILYMYIYKSAHNWCLGKSKEQWGREAIRGIKRGAASQPSFTGQWSKSNWVLFCGRTHVRTHTCTHRHYSTHIHSVTVVEAHCCQEGLWDTAGLGMSWARPPRDAFMTPNSPEKTHFRMSL